MKSKIAVAERPGAGASALRLLATGKAIDHVAREAVIAVGCALFEFIIRFVGIQATCLCAVADT